MAKKTVRDVELKGKKVLVRVDFNVPLKDGEISDENRIVQALPTIKYILEQGGKAILFSHLGRIKEAKDLEKNSLSVVAKRLSELLNQEVKFIPETNIKENHIRITSKVCPISGWVIKSIIIGKIIKKLKKYLR